MPAAKPCFYLPYGGADGTRTHDRRVANRTTGKTLGICLSKVAATKRFQGFSRSFPFLTIAYTSRPVFFGHVLATWKFQKGGGRRRGDQLLSLRITKILLTSFFIVRRLTRIYRSRSSLQSKS